ncbi:MAG: indolepyruvate ferredoxin oxidoreductase subunit alpha [Anaerolineae bacterium]
MYRVDGAICTGCGACVTACPAGAIALINGRAHIDEALCVECGSCADACPQGAITMIVASGGAYAASESERPTAVAPVAAAPAGGLRARPDVELLPAEAQRSRIWPLVGGALVWAARELLPEILAAWRTSRAGVELPANRKSVTLRQQAPRRRRTGHRHCWGRV